jgi:hypothetical protein
MVIEEKIALLKKLLNHEIFLGKFPEIKHVFVDAFGEGVDIVFSINEDEYSYKDFSKIKNNARSLVRQLSKMASLDGLRLNMYP